MTGLTRKIILALLIIVLSAGGLPAATGTPIGQASPSQPTTSGSSGLPERHQSIDLAGEIADLVVAPIDATMTGSDLLRSRPLVLYWDANPVFSLDGGRSQPFTESEARDSLARFLDLRGMESVARSEAMALFDDLRVRQIVPAPSLRSALLMLYQSAPYHVVIDSILFGSNDTGAPFRAVDFTELNYEGAVATISLDQGRYRLQIASDFANETPLQLAPVIIHESLHGDGLNSSEEELAANILDTIAYGELLMIDPSAASAATELSAYNNIQLYALLNSVGIRGGGHLGITTSVSGDVFVGPGLEDFDAGSIRTSILLDSFYGALDSGGARIPTTAARILERFPGLEALGEDPVYSEELLALIDRGVSRIITPDDAKSLAMILGLSVTLGSDEPPGLDFAGDQFSLQARPFVPMLVDLFDLNHARRPQSLSSVDAVRSSLEALVSKQPVPFAIRNEALGLFDMPSAIENVPDPQLRAALVLLWSLYPWSETAHAFLTSSPQARQWAFSFDPLPLPVNALFSVDETGRNIVQVNELLSGDSLEVIAAAILEGILLEEDHRSPNAAVVAALMSTLAYAELVTINPRLVATHTWGTISRNRDLLALINSGQWSPGSEVSNAAPVGFLAPANGAVDVLPGLIVDASSFQAHILASPRAEGAEQMSIAFASELFIRLAAATGIPLEPGPGGMVINTTTMSTIDTRLGEFLTPDDVRVLVLALFLGISPP